MNEIIGTPIEKIPFQDMYKVADLTYLHGPLLSLFRDNEDQSYIYYWCDSNAMCNRWLVFQISDEHLDGYIKQTTTLYEVVSQPLNNHLFVADIDGQGKYHSIWESEPTLLPEIYKPKVGTYYDPSSTIIYDEEVCSEFLSIMAEEIHLLRQTKVNSYLKFTNSDAEYNIPEWGNSHITPDYSSIVLKSKSNLLPYRTQEYLQ